MKDSGQNKQYRLNELLLHAIEGHMTDQQVEELNGLIVNDSDMAKCYLEFMSLYSELSPFGDFGYAQLSECDSDVRKYDLFLQSLAHQENTSPRIETHYLDNEAESQLVEKVTYGNTKFFTPQKVSLASLIISAAALLFIILFACFAPQKSSIQVATLADSINAEWSGTNTLSTGMRIFTGSDNYVLKKGYAQLRFDNMTQLTVEAPAEFQVLTGDQIKLNYGKVYAVVPQQAYGFIVTTPNAKIIDLGTEFGVHQSLTGNTELHVMKGRTNLISGASGRKINIPVTEGNAKFIVASTGNVKDIVCDTTLFVREISSQNKVVWRGQMKIDLADVVGGGNGFGTGRQVGVIDPASGQLRDKITFETRQPESNQYRQVPDIADIDGVFVPQSEKSPQVVTSQGHIFNECPVTDGTYWSEITNYPIARMIDNEQPHLVKLAGIQYGTPLHPAIMTHANTGITFDLDVIRSSMASGLRIRSFSSHCGLSDAIEELGDNKIDADIWVLVDGQQRYAMHVYSGAGQNHAIINLDLQDNDRFLTLMATSGAGGNARDWTFFGDPVLELESISQ